MKDYIYSKKFFWTLFILSWIFIILIKFSFLKDTSTSQIPFLSWFPYGFELGEVIYGISISYIVSCIFYFVAVYTPEQKRRKKAMSIIENRLDSILGSMNIIMNYYFIKHGIDLNDIENSKEKFKEITGIDFDKKTRFSYQRIVKNTGKKIPMGTGEYTEEMQLQETYNGIHINIEDIFKIPIILNIDHNLIIVLEEIDNSKFWNEGFARKNALKYLSPNVVSRTEFCTPDLGEYLYSLYLLHKELSKYITATEYTFNQPSQ